MSFAYGFGLPHWHALSGGAFSPAQLFQGGVQGAWYDPSDSTTLFSDRAGTTPCGTPGGGSVVPVGAMLDNRAAGYSVFFDGTGDNLSVADNASLNAFGDFTIEFWLNFSAVTNSTVVLGKGYTFGLIAPYLFFVNGTNLQFFASSNNSSFDIASSVNVIASASAGQWYHVVVCRSGSTLSTFSNGTRVSTVTNSTATATNAGALTVMSTVSNTNNAAGYISNLRIVKGVAVYDPTQSTLTVPTSPLSPITGTSLLTCGTSWTGNPAITKNGDARVDGLNPFQASPVGNHAIAANDSNQRPVLSARVNLLTYSEQFDNAAWTKSQSSINANTSATTDPLGGNTADKLQVNTTNTEHTAYNTSAITLTIGATYSWSLYAKAAEYSWIAIDAYDGANRLTYFDLINGVVGTNAGGNTATITSVGNGWWRCTLTRTSTGTSGFIVIKVASANNTVSFAGANGTDGIYIWGAQLTATNEFPANTYQRIVDANTYDAVGFPRYLACNGTSSAMSTPGNVNLSGTDKVAVFAGVRKLSDAAAGVLTEFTADINGNNSSFIVTAPSGAGGANYLFGSRGTIRVDATGTATFAAPVSSVVCGIGDIAGDVATLRVNGSQNATNAANQGTGNYANAALFIGSRNNASLFLTGNIYSLIVVGSAVSAGNISATEQWVAGKVGITI